MIIEEDLVLSNTNIGQIEMPNRDGFYQIENLILRILGIFCMENCQVSMKLLENRDIDVTPEDDNS